MSGVIQGSFPHGFPRLGSAQAAQRKTAPPGRADPHALQVPRHLAPPQHGGMPLPAPVLQRMEAAVGARFRDVRIHVGPHAQALGATAVTSGVHIHFAPGHYDPYSARGEQLLGRQLVHVVQQRSGRVRNPFGNGAAIVQSPRLDAEANAIVQRLVIGRRTANVIQRYHHPLEVVLGIGAHVPIRSAIGLAGHNYNNAAYLGARAQELVNAGMSQANAQALMVTLGGLIRRQTVFSRAIAAAAHLTVNHVPFAVVQAMLTHHLGALLGGATFAHYAGLLTTLTTGGRAWGYAAIDALLTAFNVNRNGLTLPQWTAVAAALPDDAHAEATAFCRIAGWNAAAITQLVQDFAANANGLTAADWIAIAGALGANMAPAATRFARVPGWNAASLLALAQDFHAVPGGLNSAQWTAIAAVLPNNARAAATGFARIANWNNAAKLALATAYGANDYNAPLAQWLFAAGRVAPNNDGGARELAHYLGNGWPQEINPFNGGVAPISLIGDGLMWGNGNPHVTIHAIDENVTAGAWRLGNREYHIRLLGGSVNVYDFHDDADYFFNNVNMGNAPTARLRAAEFRAAMGI